MEGGGGGGIGALIGLVFFVLMIASSWIVFEKAGEPGWASLIPIYNLVVMCRIGGTSPLLILGCFIPLVNLICIFIIMNGIARAFGKNALWGIGMVLVGFIMWPLLAFTAEYEGV